MSIITLKFVLFALNMGNFGNYRKTILKVGDAYAVPG